MPGNSVTGVRVTVDSSAVKIGMPEPHKLWNCTSVGTWVEYPQASAMAFGNSQHIRSLNYWRLVEQQRSGLTRSRNASPDCKDGMMTVRGIDWFDAHKPVRMQWTTRIAEIVALRLREEVEWGPKERQPCYRTALTVERVQAAEWQQQAEEYLRAHGLTVPVAMGSGGGGR